MNQILWWQWGTLVLSSLLFFVISPVAKTTGDFFKAAGEKGKPPGIFLLTSSLIISWIFAKSIANAANLGAAFGFVGGMAYAMYYLSFLVAGIVIYQLRTQGGFGSIHEFLRTKFGKNAVTVFSILIGFRLFNEVWSNTMVIGTYFGEKDSTNYYLAIVVFTGLTLAYVLKGGLKSSLLTDMIQMALFGILLFVILGILLPKENGQIHKFVMSGEWKLSAGLSLLLTAVLQSLSYPFHDPVLTDRGFISKPKTTLKSYIWAASIGFLCILLFSFVGIYAGFHQLEGDAAVAVSQTLGTGLMLVMNFIMITSAASTLDSTFTSFSKLIVVDLGKVKKVSVKRGRIVMVLGCVIGTIPIFFSPEILSATTISGTMVIGLAPIFVFWKMEAPAIAFHASVLVGVVFGLLLAFNCVPEALIFIGGKYGDLLSINIIGSLGCFLVFFLSKILVKKNKVIYAQ